ncbi:sugar MFS transporter [Weeksellaceae bacterium TAE3-ERU29]|nr:sugar MFS transporter [Weeksellaceae bacterium TAE3-ERU29]
MKAKNNYTKAFVILTTLFFMWGLITVLVDSLIPRLKDIFELSYFQAGLVQFAFFIAYGLFSIPSGFILSKIGYKKGILLGLTIMGIGCLLFYPAASTRTFSLFMLGYFTLAGGMTVLQVAANPYVTVLGSEETASSRLNLSQAFNSLGTAIAPIIGAIFLLSDSIKSSAQIESLSESARDIYYASEAAAVQSPFLVLAGILLLIAIVVSFIKLPNILSENTKERNNSGYRQALSHKVLRYGAVGIFLYVGAEVAIGSYLVNYFLSMDLPEAIKNSGFMSSISEFVLRKDLSLVDNKGIVAAFVFFYWSGAMVGRFVGAYLTKIIKPAKVLVIFAALAITMLVISMLTTGFVSMISILCVGLFNSIMFPTIFTLSLKGLGEFRPQASGVLCTAIVGGAFIPPLYGFLTDYFSFKPALLLMVLCYAYIAFFAKKNDSLVRNSKNI